jgi:hypothetical protein
MPYLAMKHSEMQQAFPKEELDRSHFFHSLQSNNEV